MSRAVSTSKVRHTIPGKNMDCAVDDFRRSTESAPAVRNGALFVDDAVVDAVQMPKSLRGKDVATDADAGKQLGSNRLQTRRRSSNLSEGKFLIRRRKRSESFAFAAFVVMAVSFLWQLGNVFLMCTTNEKSKPAGSNPRSLATGHGNEDVVELCSLMRSGGEGMATAPGKQLPQSLQGVAARTAVVLPTLWLNVPAFLLGVTTALFMTAVCLLC